MLIINFLYQEYQELTSKLHTCEAKETEILSQLSLMQNDQETNGCENQSLFPPFHTPLPSTTSSPAAASSFHESLADHSGSSPLGKIYRISNTKYVFDYIFWL